MKRKLVLLGILFILITFSSIFSYKYFKVKLYDKPQKINVGYSIPFPNITTYKSNNICKNIFSKGNRKIVFYLSSSCSACVEKLNTISTIIQAFSNKDAQFYILWEDEMLNVKFCLIQTSY